MQLSNVVLLALAGAVSADSHHHHHARHHLESRDFVRNVKGSQASPDSATSVVKAAASVATVATGSSVDDLIDGITSTAESLLASVFEPFCSGYSSKARRATAQDIAYAGNTGSVDSYGCNMKQVRNSLAGKYDYTIKVTNVADEDYQLICWNKIGRDGGINGFFKDMGESVDVILGAGETTVVAFEANTQGACGFGPGKLATSKEGCYQGTWAEFDFESTKNDGWSGADCSCLTAADTDGQIYGCHLCDDKDTCSTIYSDGTGNNSYTVGTNDLDGVGINTSPGTVQYTLLIGYSA